MSLSGLIITLKYDWRKNISQKFTLKNIGATKILFKKQSKMNWWVRSTDDESTAQIMMKIFLFALLHLLDV